VPGGGALCGGGRVRATVPTLDGGSQPAYRLPMSATDHLWHPWLRIQRVLRVMLKTWNEETWQHIKPEVADALKERNRLVRQGRFN
jgi:hypothetical protein